MNRKHLANAIRALSMDGVQQANSGHPGAPMGMADIAEVLWRSHLNHNPSNPEWADRDRFILSNGHGSMLIYSLLHLAGYELSIEDLKNFRQLHSKTPGHPEYGYAPGIETTTGPLGQGITNAVGMAMAEKALAAQFNKEGHDIVDHYTYAFMGDGCLMEGISHEACSLAGTLGLGKLVAFWDDNGISIDGEVEGWFSDDTPKRFEAYGWHVIPAVDGHNAEAINAAINAGNAAYDAASAKGFEALTAWLASYGAQLNHNATMSPSIRPTIKNTRELMRALWLASNKDSVQPNVLTINGQDYVSKADRFRYDMASRVFKVFSAMQSRAALTEDFNAAIAKGDLGELSAFLIKAFDTATMAGVDRWMKGEKVAPKSDKTTGQKLASAIEKNLADTSANEQQELFAKLVNGVACGNDKDTNGQVLAGGAAMAQKAIGGTTVARQVLDAMADSLDLESLNAIAAHAAQLAEQVAAKLAEIEAEKAEAEAAEASKAELAAKADEREQAAIAQAELDELNEAA